MRCLITGGTGFLGEALIRRLLEQGHKDLVVMARNEGKLIELKEKYPIEIIAGDIANEYSCDKACKNVNGIFHLAAFKHQAMAENHVKECIDSNVTGSINLLEMTRKYKPKFIIGISTDKVASMQGIYGVTKFLMERLFADYEKISNETQYRIVRFGNIIYSTGSVFSLWKERLINNQKIFVTNLEATRFVWIVDEAVDLIFDCLKESYSAKPKVTTMKAFQVGDLVDVMVQKYAKKKPTIEIIGLQKGENLHEKLTSDGLDSSQAERYTKAELLKLI